MFFFVWVPVQHAVMTVPASQREAAALVRRQRWQEFRHVMLPVTLPQIFVTLRVAASVAFLAVFGLEAVYHAARARGPRLHDQQARTASIDRERIRRHRHRRAARRDLLAAVIDADRPGADARGPNEDGRPSAR